MIRVEPVNATYIKVLFDDWGIEQEFAEFTSFMAPNYRYTPKFKAGVWDGRIRLFNTRNKQIYKGLLEIVYKFSKQRNYEIFINPCLLDTVPISLDATKEIVSLQSIRSSISVRDYQFEALKHVFSTKRSILVAATSAGKSLMIYSMIRKWQDEGKQTLLIVPNLNLVKQMFSDFIDYSSENGWDTMENVHTLFSGQERVFDKPVVISTWQTLLSMMKSDTKSFYKITQFDCLIGDEAHTMRSVEVSKILEAFTNTEYRVGTTGTLDGIQINTLTLTGLFGPPVKVVTARELIDAGHATDVEIRIMVLKHPEHIRKALKGMKYDEEVNHIMANTARNNFICKLAHACNGNTLILYNQVKKHGDLLYKRLQEITGKKVYYIHGKVDADEREEVRKIVESEENSIILATSQLMATGTNIPSIANLIMTMPGRSNIRIRQSIGRGLRLKDGKFLTKVFDIADDYSFKEYKNSAMKQLDERVSVYSKEEFDMKVTDIDLKYTS